MGLCEQSGKRHARCSPVGSIESVSIRVGIPIAGLAAADITYLAVEVFAVLLQGEDRRRHGDDLIPAVQKRTHVAG